MGEEGGDFGLGMWLKWFTGFPDIDSEFVSQWKLVFSALSLV